MLAYNFYVIYNLFHVRNRVHSRLFSLFATHGPQTGPCKYRKDG